MGVPLKFEAIELGLEQVMTGVSAAFVSGPD